MAERYRSACHEMEPMASNLLELLVRNGNLSKQLAVEIQKYAQRADIPISTAVLIMTPVGEERLARLLARLLKLPYFDPAQLRDLPPVMREFLSVEQALGFRALPLRLVQQGLLIALADPSDRGAQQTLGGLIGYPLIPQVAPEARLVQSIGRCYRRELPDRVRLLLEQIRPAETGAHPPFAEDNEEDESLLEEAEIVEDEEVFRAALPALDLEEGLAKANSRDDVADALIAHLAGQFDRTALFLLRNGTLCGWRALCGHQPRGGFDGVRIPVAGSAVLESVVPGKSPFLGRVPEPPLMEQLQRALGFPPEKIVLLPLILAGRTVGVLYVEDASPTLCERVADLQKLLGKASCALEILILRNKLTGK